MPDTFHFEAHNAPIPIMAARWQGEDPYAAEVVYQNEEFVKLYGDLMHQRLTDVFDASCARTNCARRSPARIC